MQLQTLNGMLDETVDDPAISTRISQYEMAFRMQTSVPELTDISKEPQHVLDAYGAEPGDGSYASNCLLARRLAERGVRFIQLYHRGWDHHGGIENAIKTTSGYVDKATAALVNDLKQRGMLDDTLVIWGGEFGRTPMAQGTGRDHHIKGFSMWMAGGGIKGGISYGNTDELGYNAVENIVHVHDFHATMLHLFGINHEKLVYRFQGTRLPPHRCPRTRRARHSILKVVGTIRRAVNPPHRTARKIKKRKLESMHKRTHCTRTRAGRFPGI